MARAALRRGIRPHIWWLPFPSGRSDVFTGPQTSGLDVDRVPFTRTGTFAGLARAFREMQVHRQPDGLVINASGRPRFWLLPLLARAASMPSVWVHQMVDSRDHRRLQPGRFGGRLEGLQLWRAPQILRHRLAATAANAVITLNAEDRERIVRWQRVRRDKIRVVPHGVDLDRFRFDAAGRDKLRRRWNLLADDADGPLIIGTAGRLVMGKGIEMLIEATVLLRNCGTPCRLVIAGDGPDRSEMQALAHRLGVAERVLFVGFVQDMPAYYSALDVFALCSATESFGLALAEAMACERVVIGTPTAGARRQIDHGHTGWQLQTFDATELADSLAALYEQRGRFSTLGREARLAVTRQFSIDLTLERTLRALSGSASHRSRLRWPGMDALPYAAMTVEDLACGHSSICGKLLEDDRVFDSEEGINSSLVAGHTSGCFS
jgi:glycosyltransferase involved in cell wall biosynthesis